MEAMQPESGIQDEIFDVVIVGGGFAGLAAAIEAAEAGASTVVLEKMKGFGGNSMISDGVMAVGGSPEQKALGIEDSPEQLMRDMRTAGLGLNHPELIRKVADGALEAYRWTVNHLGVRYLDRVDIFGGHSVARCFTTHNRSGSAIILKQLEKCRSLGVMLKKCVLVKSFLVESTGRVSGVAVRDGFQYPDFESGTKKTISAKKAVVLASGGFADDLPFRLAQDPRLDETVGSTNKPSTTAEALKAAIRIGACPVHLSWIQLGPWASPDEKMYGAAPDFTSYIAFPFGMMVDPETGRRFISELADRKRRADALLTMGRPGVALTDSENLRASGYSIDNALKKGVVKAFDSLEDLAAQYGLPEPFYDEVARYNGFVEKGEDDDFGKPFMPGAVPIAVPPFYGVRTWPKVHHTMGGVRISDEARVLNLDGQVIPGFFAAGEVTGGVHGASRLGSCAITDCLVFGRIAGQNAAKEMP